LGCIKEIQTRINNPLGSDQPLALPQCLLYLCILEYIEEAWIPNKTPLPLCLYCTIHVAVQQEGSGQRINEIGISSIEVNESPVAKVTEAIVLFTRPKHIPLHLFKKHSLFSLLIIQFI